MLAIVMSLIDHTRRGYHPKNSVLVPGKTGVLHPQPVVDKTQALPGLLIYHFGHSMYYANSQQLSEEIVKLVNTAQPPLRWFCIDASGIDDVDYSAAETMRGIFKIPDKEGVRLVVAQTMNGEEEFGKYNFRGMLGKDAFYDTLEDVIEAYQQKPVTTAEAGEK